MSNADQSMKCSIRMFAGILKLTPIASTSIVQAIHTSYIHNKLDHQRMVLLKSDGLWVMLERRRKHND